ncbi:MAG: ATP-binding cassette domain-containing protein [Candidatus Zixiibacteriota bacterium]
MSQSQIVELNNVFLKSDRANQIFKNLNFKLGPGRSAVIQGPAGSGKSSLVELMLGFRRPESGSIELFGEKIGRLGSMRLNRFRRKIGGVGGLFELIPNYTVAENIAFPLILIGARRKAIKELLLKMLSEFSLIKQAGVYPRRLTRVERTMVQFARASIANQPLMIIDEPSAGLDSGTYGRIHEFLVKATFSGRSMLILTSEQNAEILPNTDYFQLKSGELV